MDKLSFNIFPNVNFIDLCMYQFGHEQCEPGHSFGPATRNHYLFHYVLSGTGTLMADNAKGITQTYNIKSGQGDCKEEFVNDFIFPTVAAGAKYLGIHMD